MTAPSAKVRAATYERDGHRCVSCGRSTGLQFQHRAATGMGGSNVVPLVYEGVTSCDTCNPAYESHLQARALACGWKVRKWVSDQALVPVFFVWARTWYALTRDGLRVPISNAEAASRMRSVYGDEWDEEKAA